MPNFTLAQQKIQVGRQRLSRTLHWIHAYAHVRPEQALDHPLTLAKCDGITGSAVRESVAFGLGLPYRSTLAHAGGSQPQILGLGSVYLHLITSRRSGGYHTNRDPELVKVQIWNDSYFDSFAPLAQVILTSDDLEAARFKFHYPPSATNSFFEVRRYQGPCVSV
jgi:hypothetical protein